LARVIAAWPHLPLHVRQTIAALIAAAVPTLDQNAPGSTEAAAP